MNVFRVKDNWGTLYLCWRCGYTRLDFCGWKKFLRDKGKCFSCRCAVFDRKGPSESARRWKKKTGGNVAPTPSRWSEMLERLWLSTQ